MSRRVPEAAPLVGLVLAFGFALYGVLFSSDHLSTALGTVLLLYPFVAFGIGRSADPTTVFRPDAVLAAGFLAGAPLGLYGVAVGYHVRFGASVNPLPPAASLAGGLLAAAVVLTFGVASGRLLLGAVTALAVGLLAVDYHRYRGAPLPHRVRTTAVVAFLGGGLLAFGALAAVGRSAAGLATGSVLVAIGGFVALDADR